MGKSLAAIVGLGMIKVGMHWSKSIRELAVEAGLKALDDAGNPDVDAVYVSNMASGLFCDQENLADLIADYLALTPAPAVKIEAACASGGVALTQAVAAVASGVYDTILLVGVEKMSELVSTEVTNAIACCLDAEYEKFYGVTFQAANALLMRMYMEKYRVKREAFGEFVSLMHQNATKNPYAQLRFPVTVEQYLNSPVIADPIRLLDCAPVGDGAAALVITSTKKAKKVVDNPVFIKGIGQATDTISIKDRVDPLFLRSVSKAAETAFQMAGCSIEDVDVVELHDSFPFVAFMAMEALGLAERGKAYKLLENGDIKPGGKLPINLSGGLKARGHPIGATGVYQAAELSLQLIGEAGSLQADSPAKALMVSIGGVASNAAVIVLERGD